jgi:hypothetical protein
MEFDDLLPILLAFIFSHPSPIRAANESPARSRRGGSR